MKNIFLVALMFVSTIAFGQKKINKLSKQEKKDGWELLFNGRNFDGWRTFKGDKISGWKVIDGVMNNSGVGSDHGGDIITTKKYQDFELYVEWKITAESNSGIFFHADEDKGKAIYETAPEYQLLDDKGWPTEFADHQYSGANYAMHVPQNAKVKPLDKWNTTKIVVKGSHVQHYLNGKLVVEYELWSDDWKARKAKGKWKNYPNYGMSKTGYIGLQDYGGLTQFRNIKIKEL